MRIDYKTYINSQAWRIKRAQVVFRDGGRCVLCGRGGRGLEVHHLTYAQFGNELLTDLLTLCASCHGVIHQHQHQHQQRSKQRG